MEFVELAKNISSVVGCVTVCIGFIGMVCKPVRRLFTDMIVEKSGRSEIQQQMSELREEMAELKQMIQDHTNADVAKQECMENDRNAVLCLLRNAITRIYYAYLPVREIPAYEYKNMILLNEAYSKEGGNTYVATIVDDVRHSWTVLSE